VEKLDGQDHPHNYLGEVMPLGDVPKSVIRVPFGALVYFPSEAVYFVMFFGLVLLGLFCHAHVCVRRMVQTNKYPICKLIVNITTNIAETPS